MSKKLLLIVLSLCFLITSLQSQVDAHYWTHQYGAKGLLLNGAVIASSEGETSIFYNPGTMGMDDNLGFAFSFFSPSYNRLTRSNLIGDGNEYTESGFSLSPGFLGVRFKPFKTDKLVAGFTAFQRFKTDITIEDRVTDFVNNFPILVFRGDLDFERKISEDWYGLGLCYRISDKIGIGLTQFSVWHNQNLDFNLKKEILPAVTPNEALLAWRYETGYDLSVSSGFITKLGFSMRHEVINLGITVTSPIYGIVRNNSNYYLEDSRTDTTKDEAASTSSSNRNNVSLDNFKSAASIGLGLDCKMGKNVISLSMEYFSEVADYTLFEDIDDSLNGLSVNPELLTARLTTQNDAVFNIAAGILHKSSDKLTLLAGFRTDFDQNNALRLNDSAEYLGSTGDVYHVTGGGMFQFGKNQVSLGMDIGYGSSNGGRQIADITNLTQENLFEITGKDNVDSHFFSAMLFITYDFIFSKIGQSE